MAPKFGAGGSGSASAEPLIDEVAEHGDKLGEALGEDPPPSGLTHALPGQVARRRT